MARDERNCSRMTNETSMDERCRSDSMRMRHRYRAEMQYRPELNLPSSRPRLFGIASKHQYLSRDGMEGVVTGFSQIQYVPASTGQD